MKVEAFGIDESLLVYIHFGNINGNPTLKATCILNYSFAFGDTFCLHFEHTSKYLLSRVFAHKHSHWTDKEFWPVLTRRGT